MKCPVCNKDNGPGVSFCEGCGRRIPRCPVCGVELTTRDRFCANDGTRLSDDLLILVPEEFVLQEPVWRKTSDDELGEGTVAATSDRKPWDDIPPEDTVRATAVSGGNPVRKAAASNSDPVNVPSWEKLDVNMESPKRSYCENCGKRIASGNRFCSECGRGRTTEAAHAPRKTGSKKWILIVLMIILLLFGITMCGYGLAQSDLFDWGSSNRAEKTDREDEDDDEDEGEDPADSDDGDAGSGSVTEDPTYSVPGVEDPVGPDSGTETPSDPASGTEPTQAATEPPTEEEVDPLMYWIENCDKMYLSEEDLAGFDAKMCSYARNACFAKSGRKFNSTELQQYFLRFDWYNPTVSPDKFSNDMLNAYQTENINVVLEYERAHGYNQ